jgi:predicted DNA-binding transcriptional regulator AlpA
MGIDNRTPGINQGQRGTFTIPELAALLGLSRNAAYQLAARDELPVSVIRAGRRLFVSRASVESLLGKGLSTDE